MLAELYEVSLVNIAGVTLYSGFMKDIAFDIAKDSGFECTVLRDGTLIASFSPIGGWKFF